MAVLHCLQAFLQLELTTRTILASLAQSSALGLRGDAFSALLDNLPYAPLSISSSVLTILRYKQCPDALYADAHCDKGLLTAVFAPGLGLQVREPAWEAEQNACALNAYVHVCCPSSAPPALVVITGAQICTQCLA